MIIRRTQRLGRAAPGIEARDRCLIPLVNLTAVSVHTHKVVGSSEKSNRMSRKQVAVCKVCACTGKSDASSRFKTNYAQFPKCPVTMETAMNAYREKHCIVVRGSWPSDGRLPLDL